MVGLASFQDAAAKDSNTSIRSANLMTKTNSEIKIAFWEVMCATVFGLRSSKT